MGLLDPTVDGLPDLHTAFRLRVAGAESNYAIALARLGVDVTWVSSLGRDSLGDVVLDAVRGEGVDVSQVSRRSDAPTGLFMKWRHGGQSHVAYYRAGSAASLMQPEDVGEEVLDGVDHLHLTGITLAIGSGPRVLACSLASRARARGIPMSFDPNYRPALWRGADEAHRAHRALFDCTSWYLSGLDEACRLFGVNTHPRPNESHLGDLFEAMEGERLSNAVVRVGARGAVVKAGSKTWSVIPDRIEDVYDEIGAGDAFAAGFTYGLLYGRSPRDCGHCGNVVASHALRGTGDWETLPHLEEVRDRFRQEEGDRP